MVEEDGTMRSGECFVLKCGVPKTGLCFTDENFKKTLELMFEEREKLTQEYLQPMAFTKVPICPGRCGDMDRDLYPGAEYIAAAIFTLGPDAIEQIKPKLEIEDGNEVLAFQKYFAVTFCSIFGGLKPWVILMDEIQCNGLYNHLEAGMKMYHSRHEQLASSKKQKKKGKRMP